MYYGSGIARLFFLLFCILVFTGATAVNAFKALRFETYDQQSYATNMRGLLISTGIFLTTLALIVAFEAWMSDAVSS